MDSMSATLFWKLEIPNALVTLFAIASSRGIQIDRTKTNSYSCVNIIKIVFECNG